MKLSLIGKRVEIAGQFRSYNRKDDNSEKKHLDLFVFVTAINIYDKESSVIAEENKMQNIIYLDGYICKKPEYRSTPLGREISDIFIAVNRPFWRSDYIPCIAWGRLARWSAEFEVGDRIQIYGRIQSRKYFKREFGSSVEGEYKEAYEISVKKLKKVSSNQEGII